MTQRSSEEEGMAASTEAADTHHGHAASAVTQPSPKGALRGLKVIDLSRVLAGPFCAQMLADHGAEVIKVESPAGDETRRWGPPFVDEEETVSAYYHGLNRSKSNICLDLTTAAGRRVVLDLLETADVVIENFKSGTMMRWGLGYEDELSRRLPRLIYCRISGYGTDGPLGGLAGYDAALQAFGGLMSVNGEPDADPLRIGVPIVDITAANLAFSGILLALLERGISNRGQLVDITLLDAVISILHPHSASWMETGRSPRRTGAAHPTVAPYQVFATAGSGKLFISAASDRQFAGLVATLGRPELADDPRFRHNKDRIQNLASLQETLAELLVEWDASELGQALIAREVPASPVHDIGAALESAQVRHRGMLVDIPNYRGVGVPIKLSLSGSAQPRPPAHRGADTRRILLSLGYDEHDIVELHTAGVLG